jgi:hypothetical protein
MLMASVLAQLDHLKVSRPEKSNVLPISSFWPPFRVCGQSQLTQVRTSGITLNFQAYCDGFPDSEAGMRQTD